MFFFFWSKYTNFNLKKQNKISPKLECKNRNCKIKCDITIPKPIHNFNSTDFLDDWNRIVNGKRPFRRNWRVSVDDVPPSAPRPFPSCSYLLLGSQAKEDCDCWAHHVNTHLMLLLVFGYLHGPDVHITTRLAMSPVIIYHLLLELLKMIPENMLLRVQAINYIKFFNFSTLGAIINLPYHLDLRRNVYKANLPVQFYWASFPYHPEHRDPNFHLMLNWLTCAILNK